MAHKTILKILPDFKVILKLVNINLLSLSEKDFFRSQTPIFAFYNKILEFE